MSNLTLNPGSAASALALALRGREVSQQVESLSMYLYEEGIRFFGAQEVSRAGARSSGATNGFPPPELWGNIVPTLQAAEWLRAKFGDRPVRVHSGFRSPAYNAAVGGSRGSLHKRFNALDISIADVEPSELYDAALEYERVPLSAGLYSWGVHIDTRKLLGMQPWRSES